MGAIKGVRYRKHTILRLNRSGQGLESDLQRREEKVSGTVVGSLGIGWLRTLSWTAPGTHRRLQIKHPVNVFSPNLIAKGHPASNAPLQSLPLLVAKSTGDLLGPVRVASHRPTGQPFACNG